SHTVQPRRPPPLSTLFPYTTLFRSADRLLAHAKITDWRSAACLTETAARNTAVRLTGERQVWSARTAGEATRISRAGATAHAARSEEHTSELQSRENLVCRLLIEKK